MKCPQCPGWTDVMETRMRLNGSKRRRYECANGHRFTTYEFMNDIETLQRAAERITDHNVQLRAFLLRLLDPEDLGHAVTPEVRQKAQTLLTMQRPEASGK